MTDEGEVPESFGVRVLSRPHPSKADLSVTSIKRFLKLVESLGLVVRVQAARVYIEPTYYLSKSKEHNVGDVKAAGYERENVFIIATNLRDFAVSAAWYGGKFDNMILSGPRVRDLEKKLFNQITEPMKEIERCLTT